MTLPTAGTLASDNKQAQAAFYTKTKATDDGMTAACLSHAHIAWHHGVPANLDAGPDYLDQLT